MSADVLEELIWAYPYRQGDEVELAGPEFGFVIEGELAHALFADAGLAGYDGFVYGLFDEVFS
jgi:hypothetical protein